MSGRPPAFGGRGSGQSSLRARDAHEGGRGGSRGGGRGKKLLNRGMTRQAHNGNYFGARHQPLGGGLLTASEDKSSAEDHALEESLGYPLFSDGPDKLGWLMNLNASELEDKESSKRLACVNCYFMCQDGSMFKAQVEFSPYFFLQVKDDLEMEVDSWLRRKFEGAIREVEMVHKEDLDLKNHLSGLQRKLLKLTFWNSDALNQVRREVAPIVARNKHRREGTSAYGVLNAQPTAAKAGRERLQDALESIVDMREHDVPYHVRFEIDADVRCGHWYTVRAKGGKVSVERRPDLLQRAEPRICAFDIETTKLPLQFPNAEYDQVFMISYMIDRQGFLIINREVVSEDIDNFEYTPKPEFEGPFTVFNEPNEAALLKKWFQHMREVKPAVYVTYNGDYFDWPFIETRAAKCGMDMHAEIGFRCNRKTNETLSRCCVHMDCLHWVNRDSYLPQGSRGLKMVTKYKLGYDPVEVDPEDMVRLASESPQSMASYSVSDAVATYYLYMTYIHPFIFSLSTIIPMPPDEVLRKGSGTLCEMLLMVQAYKANIVAPNKHSSASEQMYKGHLLESETYIGGKVEALESGVFRADLPCKFRCKAEAYQRLLDKLEGDLAYALTHDGKMAVEDCANYEQVRDEIRSKLEALRDTPVREEVPLIYHLDVAAMYPNIILTNRLQPSSIVTDEDCAACDFNKPGKTCLRQMDWVWRGETFAATRAEYQSLKAQLQSEAFPPAAPGGPTRVWTDLNHEERAKMLKDRLKSYCQKVYKRVLDKPVTEQRSAGICQRENSFYVDTVRAFRDRRYEYKGLTKVWKGKSDEAKKSGNPIKIQEAADMCVLYDSLQLAHKCILNSFYGYVMRKGARWYSMEMAGVVTHTGANIIKRANDLISQIGRPLELDTDGIWCALPGSFPEDFKFVGKSGKVFKMSYPCAMLNVMVAENNTNDQYATLVDPERHIYQTSSEMSIEFEVDGPYKAMILPASKEEGKLIKKRYAVFNFDGSLAELKGFELKRRGELKLIKVFQGEVFDYFLKGGTLEECYEAVAAVANRWLDMLDTQGVDVTDEEVIDLISQTCVMSKSLDDYEGRKGTAITCAKRMSQFLGDERIREKGLVCNYVIARRPESQPTSERAIPVAIFSTEPSVARTYLRQWCGGDVGNCGPDEVPDVRHIVDWEYYKERLGSAIQKIITIPAAMQRVANPVPRVKHPDWLHKKVQEKEDTFKQTKLDVLFAKARAARPAVPLLPAVGEVGDLEDFGAARAGAAGGAVARSTSRAVEDHSVDVAGAGGAAADENANANAEQEEAPPRGEDFAGWLAVRKARWRRTRAARLERKRKTEAAAAGDGGERRQRQRTGLAGGVEGMFRQQAEAAASSHWQIVAIAPSAADPGTYRAWAVINGRMYTIPIRIPRTFYVDCTLPPDAAEVAALGLGPPLKRTLPGGAEAHFVYQVSLGEEEYRSQLEELGGRLSAVGMTAAYEERIAPELNAAWQLGCVAVVGPSARRRNLGDGFSLAELQMKPVVQYDYLQHYHDLRPTVLLHAADSARTRSIFVLQLGAQGRCHVWVVNPARGGQKEVTAAVAERAWSEAQEAAREAPGEDAPAPASAPAFDVHYTRSAADAHKSIQHVLRDARDRANGPSLVLLAAGDPRELQHAVPVLADFPCAPVPLDPAAQAAFPPLGWQVPATRAALAQLAVMPCWLQARIQAAQYAHLPLCNFGADWVVDTCDALYARQLREAGQLLWAADPTQPDLASRPEDLAEAATLQEQHRATQLVFPGAYRNVCVELRVNHLAVNAVLEAGLLSELEGSALVEDQAGCGPAFRVLKTLAHNWMDDASKRNNICADTLLRNMYRWICNPAARLYDPALKLAVQGLMQKLLLQLVAELQRLGASVVYADTGSLILATGKRNLTAAVGYVDYILETMAKRELFQWLSLTPTKFWHALLFRDRYNYLGLLASVPEALVESLEQQPGALTQSDALIGAHAGGLELTQVYLEAPRFDYVFNMKDYLPPALHATFMAVVTEFLWLPWKEAMASSVEGATQGGSQAVRDAAEAAEAQAHWLRTALPNYFTQKLLHQVKHMQLHMGAHDGNPEHAFPRLAGSHLTEEEQGTPALAFVKTVCHLLALDSTVTDEVLVLRRQLLRLVHCKEFSAGSNFQDPCASLVLRDAICLHCQDCQDIDVCRDPQVQQRDWRCTTCGAERDLGLVEAQLVGMLQRVNNAFQLQDLRCSKCGSVATNHLQRNCDLCGAYLCEKAQCAGSRRTYATLHSVAAYQGFEALAELTQR